MDKRELLKRLVSGQITIQQVKDLVERGCFCAIQQDDGRYLVTWTKKPGLQQTMTWQELEAMENLGDGIITGFIFKFNDQ